MNNVLCGQHSGIQKEQRQSQNYSGAIGRVKSHINLAQNLQSKGKPFKDYCGIVLLLTNSGHGELCGDAVERINSMKYLGVMFNCSLKFKDHVDHITTKASKGLAAIKIMAVANLKQSASSLISGVDSLSD